MTPPDSGGINGRFRSWWVAIPLESVGPLRFGMTMDEAASAQSEAYELRRFQAEPYFPEIVGIELGSRPAEPALYEYFDKSGRLFCIAADAVRGPVITLDGMELTGGNPAELERWLFDVSGSMGGGLRYGPRANPGIDGLGLVLRVQDTADGLLVRPVVVGRDWADRCTDDWEGAIPECEWVGCLWPDPRVPGRAKVWPTVGEMPSWAGRWSPPF
ncbi:hypothetical protein Rhe02_78340 [Rhizocola hellebori]|uniref:Uncharacterized protein n=1 Tax=Rhizocola hellebori TaxID=1392758 RepID=A0A8J3QGS2_9ACTN|nr:hypothetical protein Rhe02_78340 [Rhizocola hellebori]